MDVLQTGVGELFQLPDINAFRDWNREKPKSLVDKRMMLLATQPGVAIEEVVAKTGFEYI
jgi:hypothetical protein